MSTLVKICGITTADDARAAAEAGADMLGVNLWPGSSRYVSRETARAIRDAVDGGPAMVALFVDPTAPEIADGLAATGVTHAQIHGPVPQGVTPYIRATTPGMDDATDASWLLLDAHVPGQRGGTGRTFDWALARPHAAHRPVMLAGGLTPANVADAIAASGAQAVDVCSGVETAPGVKDHAAVRGFIAAAKATPLVMPAKAGISGAQGTSSLQPEAPAFAGATR